MNLGKIQNLGDVTIFGLNCDFVCAIVNSGRNENVFKKSGCFKQPCLEKSAFISEHSAFVKQNV